MTTRLEKLTAALEFDESAFMDAQYDLGLHLSDAVNRRDGVLIEHARLSPIHSTLKAVVEAAERIRDYAVNIEINHPDACAHGNGYSLLGQLAQQTSTDLGETLAALDSELAKLEGRG